MNDTTTDHLITQADYARRRGVTQTAVGKWIKTGKFPVHIVAGKKLIDPAEADFALDQNRARINEPSQRAHAIGGESQQDGLTAARTETERYKAKMAELAYKQRVGEMVQTDDVVAACKQCCEVLMRACEAIPARAEEILLAGNRGGAFAARMQLKTIIREFRQLVSAEFAKVAASAVTASKSDVPTDPILRTSAGEAAADDELAGDLA